MNEMLERTIVQLDAIIDTFYRWQHMQYMKAWLQYQEAMMQETDREAYSLMIRLSPEDSKEIDEHMQRLIERRSRTAC